MEEMFENNDLISIGDKLGITKPATYETIISTLFYSSKELRDEIITNISEATKINFAILNGMVTKGLSV